MAIDDADGGGELERAGSAASRESASVGEYTWEEYLTEYGGAGDGDRAAAARRDGRRVDWGDVDADVESTLGFHPDEVGERLAAGAAAAEALEERVREARRRGDDPPVAKDWYTWDDFASDHPEAAASPTETLGFDPGDIESVLAHAGARAEEAEEVLDRRTVSVNEELDEDAFFETADGASTVVSRYDIEKAVPLAKKTHFREVERYWVNKPYAFVIIFHSVKENEKKYYVIQPYMNRLEDELREFLTGKLRTAIKYSEEGAEASRTDHRKEVIEERTLSLLERYDLYSSPNPDGGVSNMLPTEGVLGRVASLFDRGGDEDGDSASGNATDRTTGELEGQSARPEPAVLEADNATLTEFEVEKLLYYLRRDFIGYERIDGIKHDINVEDISCDGYESPVFVYHSDYEQIITNVFHGTTELDDFVVKLAQRSGKGISKRSPQVDATLADGSRAQLTLGKEVSDHGTNYTIRQFKDVPFTPIDLINWKTFSLDEMAFLWLCIENHKSLIFAGGTASGKTTSLNAVSLFIPSNSKIVSIEDTREVELPQRNWIASVTRPSFSDDEQGDVDEFDLLEAALRQRPEYIVMGEIRGEEGRTLFQVMSTGHTTYTTFHADSVGEVLKRFTTDPINVSKTMFTALDLVSIQTSTRVDGRKVRRNKSLTEINHYDAENDEINVQDVYQWQAETDEFLKMGNSNTLEEIKFDRGWSDVKLKGELFKRQVVLAYLIDRGLNTYSQVAATFQAFINDQDTILSLMAEDDLEQSLEDLREMESVQINIDPEKEEMVPRPTPTSEVASVAEQVLQRAEENLFPHYRGRRAESGDVATALVTTGEEPDIDPEDIAGDHPALDAVAESATESTSTNGAAGASQSPLEDAVETGSPGVENGDVAEARGDADAEEGDVSVDPEAPTDEETEDDDPPESVEELYGMDDDSEFDFESGAE